MMFGRKQPMKELVSEFRANLTIAEEALDKERTMLVRAQFNIIHHQTQIAYMESRVNAYKDGLAEAEKLHSERKASEEAAKGAARSRHNGAGGTNQPAQDSARADESWRDAAARRCVAAPSGVWPG